MSRLNSGPSWPRLPALSPEPSLPRSLSVATACHLRKEAGHGRSRVLEAILFFLNTSGLSVTRTVAEVAAQAELSIRQTQRCLRQLSLRGLISITQSAQWEANTYTIVCPSLRSMAKAAARRLSAMYAARRARAEQTRLAKAIRSAITAPPRPDIGIPTSLQGEGDISVIEEGFFRIEPPTNWREAEVQCRRDSAYYPPRPLALRPKIPIPDWNPSR